MTSIVASRASGTLVRVREVLHKLLQQLLVGGGGAVAEKPIKGPFLRLPDDWLHLLTPTLMEEGLRAAL